MTDNLIARSSTQNNFGYGTRTFYLLKNATLTNDVLNVLSVLCSYVCGWITDYISTTIEQHRALRVLTLFAVIVLTKNGIYKKLVLERL